MLIAAEWVWTKPSSQSVVDIDPVCTFTIRRLCYPRKILGRQLDELSLDTFSCKLEVRCD